MCGPCQRPDVGVRAAGTAHCVVHDCTAGPATKRRHSQVRRPAPCLHSVSSGSGQSAAESSKRALTRAPWRGGELAAPPRQVWAFPGTRTALVGLGVHRKRCGNRTWPVRHRNLLPRESAAVAGALLLRRRPCRRPRPSPTAPRWGIAAAGSPGPPARPRPSLPACWWTCLGPPDRGTSPGRRRSRSRTACAYPRATRHRRQRR
mmetsp:Transcript_29213/g.85648  ORF Transcript_29213/g.85648 Transcript_29213/m.85648 type:complete len:204 (-) Transcript_29213:788-1399(-)